MGVWWFKDIPFGSQLWLPSTKPTYILPDTTENHHRLKNVFPGDGGYVSSFPGGGYLVVGTQIWLDLEKPKLPDRFSGRVFVSSSLEIQFQVPTDLGRFPISMFFFSVVEETFKWFIPFPKIGKSWKKGKGRDTSKLMRKTFWSKRCCIGPKDMKSKHFGGC